MAARAKGQTRGRNGTRVQPVQPAEQIACIEEARDPEKRRFRRSITIAQLAKMIPGGRRAIAEYARLAAETNPDIERMIKIWAHGRAKHGTGASLEKACYDANLSVRDLFTSITAMMYELNVEGIGNMIAAIGHPEIVRTSVKEAKRSRGVRDREMLFKHAGFLPMPKGSTINLNNLLYARQNAGASEENEERGLPSFEQTTATIVKVIRGDQES